MRLGWIGYLAAALLLIAGVTGTVFFATSRFGALQNAFTRVVVPGSIELTLERPGTYTIFHEPESVIDGKLYSAKSISGLAVTVTSLDGGQSLALTPPMGTETYSAGGHSGTAVLVFTVAKPGQYRLAASYPDRPAGPKTVLAISQGFVGSLLTLIFGTIALGLGSVVLSVGIAVATLLVNRRAAVTRAA